ncbi:hypothetical protein DFP72DRAFT_830205 [Ephemerocybe angulata]|uniref:DUF6729 domain-containing protein n=1 Tax=Ephemerocybe angulata TaxID=980116 RepID=A0A8H6LUG5_9AGAR|nr:hypothetical protein DFP72DRAFT_830205 [Tulosesus angulatus]
MDTQRVVREGPDAARSPTSNTLEDEADGSGVGEEDGPDGEDDEADTNTEGPDPDEAQVPRAANQRRPLPDWLTRQFNAHVEECRKRDSTGCPPLYANHKTFWFPQASTWFLMQRSDVTPELLHNPKFFLWDPRALAGTIPCPNCRTELQRHTHIPRPRRCVSFNSTFWMIGFRYRCPKCSTLKQAGINTTFRSWDSRILALLPPALAAEFPAHLSHRTAMDKGLVEWMRSCYQNGVGSRQFSDMMRVQHSNDRVAGRGPIAIIQIAYKAIVYIFQVSDMIKSGSLPHQLKGFLSNPHIWKRCIPMPNGSALNDLCALVLGKCLRKNVPERIGEGWEAESLTEAQTAYAACDAYASLQIFNRLTMIPIPRPVTSLPRNEPGPGTLVLVYSEDGRTVIARGCIAPESSGTTFDGLLLRSHLVIKIQHVNVPGAVLSTHRGKALSEFGPIPFSAIVGRSNLRTYQPLVAPIVENHPDSEPSPVSPERSHTPAAATGSEPSTIPSSELMPDSDENPVFPNLAASLLSWISSWTSQRSSLQTWVLSEIRRIIPPPDQLYAPVAKVFATYGPLKDAATKAPLFNTAAWKTAKQILQLIYDGFVSDPPGINLYVETGSGEKTGLPIYRCIRGTNNVEGGVHTHLRSHLPSNGTSIRHAQACLMDFVLRHNLQVGVLNSTGKRYKGHFDIWVTNEIHQLSILLRDKLEFRMPWPFEGWLNTKFYQASSEVIGILPVPRDVQLQNGISEYVENMTDERPPRYDSLARLQGTRKAILPVHTEQEFMLFKDLMQQNTSFRHPSNAQPSYPEAARIWNSYADLNSQIYYTVHIPQLFLTRF